MIAHYAQTLRCGNVRLLAMWLIRRINLLSVNAARARQRISDALGHQCGVRTRRCLDGSLWLVKSSKIQGKIGIKWRDHDTSWAAAFLKFKKVHRKIMMRKGANERYLV